MQCCQIAHLQSQQSNLDISARVSHLERYRYVSLLKFGETRNKFVLVDDISREILRHCNAVDPLTGDSPAQLHSLSKEGQLAELETALVSLGTCLSPWVRPRLDLSTVDFVNLLREDLIAAFESFRRNYDAETY